MTKGTASKSSLFWMVFSVDAAVGADRTLTKELAKAKTEMNEAFIVGYDID